MARRLDARRHERRGARPRAAVRSGVHRQREIYRAAGGHPRRRLPRQRALRGAAPRVADRAACTAQPFRDFVTVSRKLFPDALRPRSMFDAEGVAPGAIVHPTAEIEDGVIIDPGAVIGPRCRDRLGDRDRRDRRDRAGRSDRTRTARSGPASSIVHALIGDNVILHAGCRIGQDGFRYHPTAKGHVKVPQLGRVILQDHVETRRQHRDRPWRQRRHRDRRGHQDR